jgi:hypothetical protein
MVGVWDHLTHEIITAFDEDVEELWMSDEEWRMKNEKWKRQINKVSILMLSVMMVPWWQKKTKKK